MSEPAKTEREQTPKEEQFFLTEMDLDEKKTENPQAKTETNRFPGTRKELPPLK